MAAHAGRVLSTCSKFSLTSYLCIPAAGMQRRCFALRRFPIRILDDKASAAFHENENSFKTNKNKLKKAKPTSPSILKSAKTDDRSKKILRFNNGEEIEVTDVCNNEEKFLGSELVKVRSKKERLHTLHILLEGRTLMADALSNGVKPLKLYVSKKGLHYLQDLLPFLSGHDPDVFYVTDRGMQVWSDMSTAPGILGIFKLTADMYKHSVASGSATSPARSLPVTVVCDDVRLPDNVSAILRSAVASGCSKVLLSSGCCDVWDGKVLRGAAGAHFRIPFIQHVQWPELPNYLEDGCSVYVCDNQRRADERLPAVPHHQAQFGDDQNICLIVGNEAHGVSRDARKFAEARRGTILFIPMMNNVESLNVAMAATVLCFEIQRQLSVRQETRGEGVMEGNV